VQLLRCHSSGHPWGVLRGQARGGREEPRSSSVGRPGVRPVALEPLASGERSSPLQGGSARRPWERRGRSFAPCSIGCSQSP
jgi:hypothetical protein